MTIITISTTGYAEVHPLTGAGRVLTIGLIISGVSTLAYIGGRVAQVIIEARVLRRRRMNKMVQELKDHYIVCGFGRLGQLICDEMAAFKMPFVVIENAGDGLEKLSKQGYLYAGGDATRDEVLINAGIHRASGLISVLGSDAENVYAILSAKVLNPDIYVVTRAIEEDTERKLQRAGANRIVKPYEIGANRMVNLLRRPGVVDFMDIVASKDGMSLSLEETRVCEPSGLIGKTLAESSLRNTLNIIIVSILRRDGSYVYNPASSDIIEAGDLLIAIGESNSLNQLNEMCGS